jgi:hypothetical protein
MTMKIAIAAMAAFGLSTIAPLSRGLDSQTAQAQATTQYDDIRLMARGGGGRGGGGGMRGGGGMSRGGGGYSGGARNVRSSASGNVNFNGNRNTNINRNTNVNVNNNINGGCCYNRNWDHPVAAAAVVGATVAATAAAVGSVAYSIPPTCGTAFVNDVSYYQCGSTWYQPQYVGTDLQYEVVDPPQ